MLRHAQEGLPNEACGILGGRASQPTRFCPANNAEKSPTRYVVDPKDQLRIMRELDDADLDMLGIFHSHTHTQAYPSSTDINLAANWPDAYYVIASLMADEPVLRAFRIVSGKVTEEPITYE